jgi:hypothetical protein
MLHIVLAGSLHHGVQERPVPGPVQLAQCHLQLLARVDTWGGMHATDSTHLTCSIGLHRADMPIPVQWASWHIGCKCWDFSTRHFVLRTLLFSSTLSILTSLNSLLLFFLSSAHAASWSPSYRSHKLSWLTAFFSISLMYFVCLFLSVSMFVSPSLSACQ